MLNFKVIGAGAAGNKAAIRLIQSGFNADNVTLINSTSKDIQETFKDKAIIFGTGSDTLGGCGKERSIGKKLVLADMKSGSVDLDSIPDPDTHAIIIVTSTEGGSGSAVTPIMAKYIKEVLNIPVIICLFFGFNTDVRGMQNSIEICQELSDDYGVIGIANAKFLDESGNTRRAEQAANDKFVELVRILSGQDIVSGEQNIDDTDLFKLVTTPGYIRIETANISKIKNADQFNKAVSAAIDSTVLMDCPDGAKRIGMIFNMSGDISDFVDYSGTTIKKYYGIPYEMFTHVQESSNIDTLTWIATGLPMPIKEVQEIYDNYLKNSASVNKSKDSFFDAVGGMSGNQEDGMFDMLSTHRTPDDTTRARSSFFQGFGISDKTQPKFKVEKKDGTSEKGEY